MENNGDQSSPLPGLHLKRATSPMITSSISFCGTGRRWVAELETQGEIALLEVGDFSAAEPESKVTPEWRWRAARRTCSSVKGARRRKPGDRKRLSHWPGVA